MTQSIRFVFAVFALAATVLIQSCKHNDNNPAGHNTLFNYKKVYRDGTLYREYHYDNLGRYKGYTSTDGHSQEVTYDDKGKMVLVSIDQYNINFYYHPNGDLDYYTSGQDGKNVFSFENGMIASVINLGGDQEESKTVYTYTSDGMTEVTHTDPPDYSGLALAEFQSTFYSEYNFKDPTYLVWDAHYYLQGKLPKTLSASYPSNPDQYHDYTEDYTYQFDTQGRMIKKTVNHVDLVTNEEFLREYTYEY